MQTYKEIIKSAGIDFVNLLRLHQCEIQPAPVRLVTSGTFTFTSVFKCILSVLCEYITDIEDVHDVVWC